MRHTAPLALALLLLIGCDSPPPPTDGGGADAGPPDAGPVQVCERDADCDDGEFCNGPESCRPGEGDARGCVGGEAPCEAMCDEASDECRLCTRAEGDQDGDGAFSIACGGDDCDDEDPLRSGSMIEVCDVFGVDEDCNLETLYNAAGSGAAGDRDGDGHVDSACANIVGDEERRGDDCDDRDGAVFAGAAERCNGVDDDCDGALDEDFDCVQSADVLGVNACGHEGTRRCSETCEWIDDAFLVPESIATCDYCDDSGMGLEQELPFTRDVESARCVELEARGATAPPTEACILYNAGLGVLPLVNAGADEVRVGGLVNPNYRIGYEQQELRATFSGTGRPQYALGFSVASNVLALGGPDVFGLPVASVGFAVRTVPPESDPEAQVVELVRVTSLGEVQLLRTAQVLGEEYELTFVPDDPATPTDETRVTTRSASCGDPFSNPSCALTSGVAYLECVNDPQFATDPVAAAGGATVPCGVTLQPGDDLTSFVVGTAGGTGSSPSSVALESFSVAARTVCR